MALVVEQVRDRGGHVGREPLAMGIGNHSVVASLPDVDRDPDRVEVEAPRADERHVVVEPAPVRLAQRLAERRRDPFRECAGQRASIDVVDEIPKCLGAFIGRDDAPDRPATLLEGNEGFRTLKRSIEFLEVLVAHALEKVDPFRGVRRDSGERRGGADPARKQRGAGEGVRTAAGPAKGERGRGADMVEHRRRVIHDVGNGPALAP